MVGGSSSNCGSNATYVQLASPYPAGVVEEYGIDLTDQSWYPAILSRVGRDFFRKLGSGLSRAGQKYPNGAIINGHGEAGLGSPLFNSNFLDVS